VYYEFMSSIKTIVLSVVSTLAIVGIGSSFNNSKPSEVINLNSETNKVLGEDEVVETEKSKQAALAVESSRLAEVERVRVVNEAEALRVESARLVEVARLEAVRVEEARQEAERLAVAQASAAAASAAAAAARVQAQRYVAPVSSCHPSYTPCIPNGPDLDCADVRPLVGSVRVIGPDSYRLDGDKDGIGCE
jgi:hypothetical protein